MEARHLFSTTPATPTDPLPTEETQSPELLAADPSPLDSHWAPIVYAGADFTIAAGVSAQLNAELIATGPVNMTLLWSKVSGPGQATFGNATTLNSTVQFDTAGTYVLDLTVTTDYATKSDQLTVTVLAGNHNPVFTSSASANVAENTTTVMTVTATDADLPAQSLSYSIVGGADQAKFSITSGGALTFKTAPNYEAPTDANGDNAYVVSVQVSDGVGGTATQTINVSVTPTNDNNPVFSSPASKNVAENTTAVMTVTATDADLPAQSLTFSIAGSGADNAKFSITSGGVLTFKSAPNYEAPTDANGDNVYVVSVQVSDGVGGTATQTINVSVTPTNDNNPVFTSPTSAGVADGTTAVMTVTATDADAPAQSLTFSITGSGADNAKFSITPGGVLTFKTAPSFAAPGDANGDNVYVVTVQASDGAGGTTTQTVSVQVTASNVINIDQAWLDAQGDGPYYLNQQGKTYRLQTDVTTDGTAFAIIASNVTFDLNGHTITYDNATPITVPNGSFEAGSGASATGWDFSHAANAVRYDGTGRWIYNEVYDGNYSIKFNNTTLDEYIESTGTVTLQANTTYTLSGMFEYGGQGRAVNNGAEGFPLVKGYVQLLDAGDNVVAESAFAFTNNRGIQLVEDQFTTGGVAADYKIRVGIEGDPLGADPFYIDDIKIQRTKDYGVTTQVYSWATDQYLGEFTQYGLGTNATVMNGTIVQGQNNGSWSHAVMMHQIDGVTIDDLNITVQGHNTSAIFGHTQNDKHVTVTGNTITSNVKTVSSRDNADGAVINHLRGEIAYNTITTCPHFGITAAGDDTQIHHNTISGTARYTNAFAISFNAENGIAGVGGASVHDNIIANDAGDKYGPGIMLSGDTPTAVYSNTIAVRQHDQNQEYEGDQQNGVYGIQIERGSHKEIYNNTVITYSSVAAAHAFRIGGSATIPSSDNYIHDNVFEAVRLSGTKVANAIRLTDVGGAENTRFVNNTLRSNDAFFSTGSNLDIVMEHTTFQVIGNAESFNVIESIDAGPTVVEVRDPVFADQATIARFDNAVVAKTYGTVDPLSSLTVSWTTTVQVKDGQGQAVVGAAVTIDDKNGNEVFSGVTDANGLAVAVIKQYKVQGNVKTDFGPYTVVATKDGQQIQQQFTANQTQTIAIQVPAPAGSGSSSSSSSSSAIPASAPQSLVAAVPTAVLNGSELRVTGTDGDDVIKFYQSGKYIYLQGSADYWKASKVKSIYVDAKDGENIVSFDSYANGGTKALKEVATVIGGSGTTHVSSSAAQDISFSGPGGYASVGKKGDVTLYGAAVAAGPEAPLTAGPTAVLSGGQLRVTGTDDDDIIKFFQSGKNIYIQGVAGYWSASKVKSIYVDPRGGDDFVSFNSYANGGNKALKETATVVGGTGTERVSVGAAHDVYFSGQGRYATVDKKGGAALNGVPLNLQSYATGSLKKGVLTILGTNGNDNLKFAHVNGYIYVTGVYGSFKASKVKSIVVRLQDGNDNVSLNSLANGGQQNLAVPVTIYSGAGTQSVRLANSHDIDISGAGHTLYVAASGTAFLDGQQVDPAPGNWFDANIQDAALRALGHNLYLDSLIDRSDILALFTDSKDGGVIDATELADLQKIADNAGLFGSNDYLRGLTNYIAHGSAANANYQGQALGNLMAGSVSTQLDKLVNKWFFGLDRPTAGGTYQPMAGSLFVSGPAYSDIRQGTVGDNYYLASLAETAFRSSSTITSMFIVNGDGTYGVKFYDPQGHAQYVTVDSYLPTDANGKLMYASRGQTYNNASNELWVALAEKAYAQLNEFGWSRAGTASSGDNSYAALDGGYIHQTLSQIANSTTTAYAYTNGSTSFNDFVSAYNAGQRIGFASLSTPAALSGVVGSQAYAVVGYNSTAQTVTLFNPWGTEFGLKTLNWNQIQQNFEYFDRTA